MDVKSLWARSYHVYNSWNCDPVRVGICDSRLVRINNAMLRSRCLSTAKLTRSILLDPDNPILNPPLQKIRIAPPPSESDFDKLSQYEQRVLSNPFAMMLASPVRRDIHSERMIPNALMIRFIRAFDNESKRTWIVPDKVSRFTNKRTGIARWIRAEARVIQHMGTSGRYRLIDNKGFWRPDMAEHVGKLLRESILDEVKVLAAGNFIEKTDSSDAIQCNVTFDPGDNYSRYVEGQSGLIPLYRIHTDTGFTTEQVESMKEKCKWDMSALVATPLTRNLAAALWKLRQYRGEHLFTT